MMDPATLYQFPEQGERPKLWDMIRINGDRMTDRERWARELGEMGRENRPVIEQLRAHEAIQDMLLHISQHEASFRRWYVDQSRGKRRA